MTRTLLVTPAEMAAGWVVRPGEMCHSARCGWSGPPPWPDDCRCKGQMQPPADLLAAVAPCETCEARAERLHIAYEQAAVDFGWATQERSRKPWAEVPAANKATMIAALRVVFPCPDCRITLLGECPECLEGCDIATCRDCGEDFTEPCDRHLAAGHVPSADPYGDGLECESCCRRCGGSWRSVTLGYAYPVGDVEMRDDTHYMLRLEVGE